MTARSLLKTTLALTIAVTGVSCGYDGEQLQDRRCENNAACHVRFGEEYSCLSSKYCAKVTLACRDAQDCDDGIYCNGPETCDPDNAAAGVDGCVPPDTDRFLHEGPSGDPVAACVTVYCDEKAKRVIQDPSGCGCANDTQCADVNTDPCKSSECGPDMTCVTVALGAGEPCEDGIACTINTICNDAGECIYDETLPEPSAEDDTLCDDGIYCNGEEVCDHLNEEADALTGCIPGTPPTESAADSIECTVAFCDEEAGLVYQDTTGCECQVPADCEEGGCNAFFCSEATGYRCVQDPAVTLLPEGTPCDDTFTCTANDVCTSEGMCVGRTVDLLCDIECGGSCEPESDVAAASGCVCP